MVQPNATVFTTETRHLGDRVRTNCSLHRFTGRVQNPSSYPRETGIVFEKTNVVVTRHRRALKVNRTLGMKLDGN